MKTHIQKWGNSLALRIPKVFADEANLKQGSSVEISLCGDKLLIAPLNGKFTLSQLLKGVTKENIHAEMGIDSAVGKEIW